MFLFFLLQTVDHIHKNYMYSSQLCNLLYRKQYIINIITENRNHYDYFCLSLTSSLKIGTIMIIFLLKLMWHSCSFMFLKVNTLKTSYFEKKPSILGKFQWSHEKCSYFPIQRLDCSCFFVHLRPAYVLKMFLFLKKNKPLCSYKHGSYKKKRVIQWNLLIYKNC